MALLRMQADMQCTNYFPTPGHYFTWDLNLGTNGNIWPLNNADQIFKNGPFHNGALLPRSPNQHLVHSKEVLKQTMLKHEAIFQDQVHELHRIYWRQKELMDEMKKNEFLKHHLELGSLQSNLYLSQNLCDYGQKKSHVTSFPRVNLPCNQSSVSTAENTLLLSHFDYAKYVQSGLNPAQTEFTLKGCESESSKKFGKKILDLELPPEDYIDEEEEYLQKVPEVSDNTSKRISEVVHKSDRQSDHGSGGFNMVFQEDDLNPGPVSSGKKILADLNEPIKLEEEANPMPIYIADLNEPVEVQEEAAAVSKYLADLNEPIKLQEETASGSSKFPSPFARDRVFSCLSKKYNSGLQVSSKNEMHNNRTGRDLETCSNSLHLEKEKMQEWTSYDDEAGRSGSDIASLSPGFSEEVSVCLEDVELKQAHEHATSHLINQPKRKSCSEGLENLQKDFSTNCYTEPVSTPNIGTSCQLISPNDVGNSEAFSVSCLRKHKRDILRTPTIVQALPCFNTSIPLRKRYKSSITVPGVTSKRCCHSKNLKSRPKFDTTSFHESSFRVEVKPAEEMNSSFMSQICANGVNKHEDSARGLRWLKTKSICKRKRGKRSELSTQVETHQNPSEDDDIKNSANGRVNNINLDCDPLPESAEQVTSHKLVVGGGIDKKSLQFGVGINLNSCTDENESSSSPSLSAESDLEAPASSENKESSPPRGESDVNQVETPFELSGKEDGDVQEDLARNAAETMITRKEARDLQDELFRNAATALVSISSSVVQNCVEMVACKPSEPCCNDDLYWFAKVVSLVGDDPDSEFGIVLSSKDCEHHEESLSGGLDYFEAMTLKLTETKVEEDWCKKNDQKHEKKEETDATSLPSPPNRGRMRRGRRQHKDFQSEILPSLVSLSRCEVTEDLQTIEGLIQAANSQWGTVLARSVGTNARARGKRRTCISASKGTDIPLSSSSKQHTSFRNKDNKEGRLIGWGNITRRRRGPRCPASNPRLIASQVQ